MIDKKESLRDDVSDLSASVSSKSGSKLNSESGVVN